VGVHTRQQGRRRFFERVGQLWARKKWERYITSSQARPQFSVGIDRSTEWLGRGLPGVRTYAHKTNAHKIIDHRTNAHTPRHLVTYPPDTNYLANVDILNGPSYILG